MKNNVPKQLVYATTNPGKFEEVKKLFSAQSLTLHSPQEFGVHLDVDETGSSLEENATLKAETYRDALPPTCIVLGDDTGVEIDALGGEPGIHVRRWKGYPMSDQAIYDYTLERLQNVPAPKRTAQFRTIIAVASAHHKTRIFTGILHGRILVNPGPIQIQGFPFEPLFYVPRWRKVIGQVYQMSPSKRETFPTHRHLAVKACQPYLCQLLSQE